MSKWIGLKVSRKLERCRETGVETQASARHLHESLADSGDLVRIRLFLCQQERAVEFSECRVQMNFEKITSSYYQMGASPILFLTSANVDIT
jgi:hypothetical protein